MQRKSTSAETKDDAVSYETKNYAAPVHDNIAQIQHMQYVHQQQQQQNAQTEQQAKEKAEQEKQQQEQYQQQESQQIQEQQIPYEQLSKYEKIKLDPEFLALSIKDQEGIKKHCELEDELEKQQYSFISPEQYQRSMAITAVDNQREKELGLGGRTLSKNNNYNA
jgi:hypothetical protein